MSNSVFDKLISDLTVEERHKMAEKMKTAAVVSGEPLTREDSEEKIDYTVYVHNLTIFERILIFLKSIFTSTEKDKVLGDYLITKLGRSIEKNNPGLILHNERVFTEKFYNEIISLRDSLYTLRDTVLFALEINRMDFLSFLGGWFLPEIQQRFTDEADPWKLDLERNGLSNFEIRRELEFRMEDILGAVSEEDRRMMYRYSRSLHLLGVLLKFDFDRILNAFGPGSGKSGKSCRFSEVRKSIKELSNILHSLKYPPEQELFKAVFYYYMIQNNSDPEDIESLNSYLETAENSMNAIRIFNKRVPMDNILKIIYRNINYNSVEISGGEDWYALYKKFWYKRFEVAMLKFTQEKKKTELLNENLNLLKAKSIQYLNYYRSGIWGDETYARFENSAAVVNTFLLSLYAQELLPALKLILEDGKFYKEQNQRDYAASYTSVTQTLEKLKIIDSSLAPGGEYSQEIKTIKESDENDLIKIDRIKKLFQKVDGKVEEILREFISALSMMGRILNGITHGDIGGPYDTLSNLGYIGKGKNNDLISVLVKIGYTIDRFLDHFSSLFDVEKNSVTEI